MLPVAIASAWMSVTGKPPRSIEQVPSSASDHEPPGGLIEHVPPIGDGQFSRARRRMSWESECDFIGLTKGVPVQ